MEKDTRPGVLFLLALISFQHCCNQADSLQPRKLYFNFEQLLTNNHGQKLAPKCKGDHDCPGFVDGALALPKIMRNFAARKSLKYHKGMKMNDIIDYDDKSLYESLFK